MQWKLINLGFFSNSAKSSDDTQSLVTYDDKPGLQFYSIEKWTITFN